MVEDSTELTDDEFDELFEDRGSRLLGAAKLRNWWNAKDGRAKLSVLVVIGAVSCIVLFIYSLTQGIYTISFRDSLKDIINIIVNLGPETTPEKVIHVIRAPRSIAVMCVGAGLAVAGAVMQALIRNPLVDPYITGVSSGASFMVVAVSMLGSIGGLAVSIPIAAIIGALIAFGLTMFVAELSGGRPTSYVLSGVIISTGLSAAVTLIIYFNAKDYEKIMKWMFGSFLDIPWKDTLVVIAGTLIPIILSMLFAKKLNIMLLGDEQAKYMGLDTSFLKRELMVLIAVLTAFCVAYCGVIGFVGLIVPHVCRMIVGGDHRLLIPASAITGACLLLVADICCKTLANPSELPIGAIVAVVGVPFFLMLMIREGKRYVM